MDKHDKEFEAYLRQFRLRQPGPPPEMAYISRRSSTRWMLAAAIVVMAIGISTVLVRNSGSGSGPKATVEAAGSPSLYRVGETVEAGRIVQSNSAVGLLLALEDGSRVEMKAQSELKLESAADGIRVRLNEGSILVTAAKQDAGHLYVQTRDATVTVVGTVFLVRAEESGTNVAVVEGEVHVQQGAEMKKLLPGEQLATNSTMQLKPVAEQISWSRSAPEYLVLLPQPPAVLSKVGPTHVAMPQQAQRATEAQSAPLQATRAKEFPAKTLFDSACTACHNADVAMRMEGRGTPLSSLDREMLVRRRSELADLFARGLTSSHPDARMLNGLIAELESREVGVTGNYGNYVSRHLKGFGETISSEQISVLASYLYEETSRKLDATTVVNPDLVGEIRVILAPVDPELGPGNSQVQRQGPTVRQERPATPPVQPTDKDGTKEDPDVAGARILNSACTSCHDLGAVTGRKEDRASWERIVNGMIGYGAGVKDSEIPVLVDYLFKHYGPVKAAPKKSP